MAAAPAASADEEVAHAELTTFQCREAYVYKIPPASTVGHRAEMWDVDHWLQEVSAAVVACGDECWVRLFDKATSELFAECPIPQDRPIITVVEPVVDSSRYYVLRIVDRASQRHAFIGVGFRERGQASDFNSALDDHLQYLRRQKEAARMKAEYAAAASENAEAGGSSGSSGTLGGPARDLALKPGETIKVALPNTRASDGGSATTPPMQRLGSLAAKAQFSLFSSPTPVKLSGTKPSPGSSSDGGSPGVLLPPPPPRRLMPQPSAKPGDALPGPDSTAASAAASPSASAAAMPRPSPMAVSPKHPNAAAARPSGAAGGSQDGFHARFTVAEDAVGGQASRLAEGLGPRSMRVSINMDDDAASEAASLANLSMKAHTSGGSSLAGSATYSDGGNSEAAADEEAEAHRAAHAAASEMPDDAAAASDGAAHKLSGGAAAADDAAAAEPPGNAGGSAAAGVVQACDAGTARGAAPDAAAAAEAPQSGRGAGAKPPTSADAAEATGSQVSDVPPPTRAGAKDEWGDFVS